MDMYERMMIYDNYFISFNPSTYESKQATNDYDRGHIFIADLITANAAMLIHLKCIGGYYVIANDSIGITQCLLKYYLFCFLFVTEILAIRTLKMYAYKIWIKMI